MIDVISIVLVVIALVAVWFGIKMLVEDKKDRDKKINRIRTEYHLGKDWKFTYKKTSTNEWGDEEAVLTFKNFIKRENKYFKYKKSREGKITTETATDMDAICYY